MNSLIDFSFRHHLRAGHGQHGRGKDKRGRDADDLVLKVPLGTLVREESTGDLLGDLTLDGQRLVLARGGRGGKGNARFATSTRQAPRFSTPPGEGEERWLLLELKSLADVGLVGFPNAGKSSLLSRLSAARPRVASYPFTTLTPHLGVLESPDGERIVVADIPGLVEGAHRGAGLGLRFLRHIDRTHLLLYVLDLDPDLGRDPRADLGALEEEIRQYQPSLIERPKLVVLNKVDLPGARERGQEVKGEAEARGIGVYFTSAVTGEGLQELAEGLILHAPVNQSMKGTDAAGNEALEVGPGYPV
jgi:GTP-binding protein